MVELSKESIKDSLAHGIGKAKSPAYAAVPEIIKDGALLSTIKKIGKAEDKILL
jgi:hypothetical protein